MGAAMINTSIRHLAVSFCAALMLVSTAWADAAPQPSAATVVTAGADDTNGEAGVAVGGHVLVKLPVAGGTGYSWRLSGEAGPELSFADQRVERSAPRLGAPQVAVFDFEAQAAGEKSLTFDFVAPGASEPTKIYTLTVTISD